MGAANWVTMRVICDVGAVITGRSISPCALSGWSCSSTRTTQWQATWGCCWRCGCLWQFSKNDIRVMVWAWEIKWCSGKTQECVFASTRVGRRHAVRRHGVAHQWPRHQGRSDALCMTSLLACGPCCSTSHNSLVESTTAWKLFLLLQRRRAGMGVFDSRVVGDPTDGDACGACEGLDVLLLGGR